MQMFQRSTLCDLPLPAAHFPKDVEKTGLHPTNSNLVKPFWESLKLAVEGSKNPSFLYFDMSWTSLISVTAGIINKADLSQKTKKTKKNLVQGKFNHSYIINSLVLWHPHISNLLWWGVTGYRHSPPLPFRVSRADAPCGGGPVSLHVTQAAGSDVLHCCTGHLSPDPRDHSLLFLLLLSSEWVTAEPLPRTLGPTLTSFSCTPRLMQPKHMLVHMLLFTPTAYQITFKVPCYTHFEIFFFHPRLHWKSVTD